MIEKDYSWIQPLIGKPWSSGARGPDEFDCWGLLWHVYTKVFGLMIPEYPSIDPLDLPTITKEIRKASTNGSWTLLDKPEHGCAVGMSGHTLIHHVGIWIDIDGGLILHSRNKANVMAETTQRIRDRGINNIQFYKLNAI